MATKRQPPARSPRGTTKVSTRTAERRAEEDHEPYVPDGVPPADPVDGPPVDLEEEIVLDSVVDLETEPAVDILPAAEAEGLPDAASASAEDLPVTLPVTTTVQGYMHPQGSPERPVEVDLPPQDRARPEGAPHDGWLLWPGDPIVFPHTDFGMWITPKINVYRLFYVKYSKRPSFQMLFPAGVSVPRTHVDRLNAPVVTSITESIAQHHVPLGYERSELLRL